VQYPPESGRTCYSPRAGSNFQGHRERKLLRSMAIGLSANPPSTSIAGLLAGSRIARKHSSNDWRGGKARVR
jgi:hypothetical protein